MESNGLLNQMIRYLTAALGFSFIYLKVLDEHNSLHENFFEAPDTEPIDIQRSFVSIGSVRCLCTHCFTGMQEERSLDDRLFTHHFDVQPRCTVSLGVNITVLSLSHLDAWLLLILIGQPHSQNRLELAVGVICKYHEYEVLFDCINFRNVLFILLV